MSTAVFNPCNQSAGRRKKPSQKKEEERGKREREKYEEINILFYRESIAGEKSGGAQIVNARERLARSAPAGIKISRRVERAGEEGGKHSAISSAVRLLGRVLESSEGCNDCTRAKLRARARYIRLLSIIPYYLPRALVAISSFRTIRNASNFFSPPFFLPRAHPPLSPLPLPFIIAPVSRALDRRRSIPPVSRRV